MFPDSHTHLPDTGTASLRIVSGTSPDNWDQIAALAESNPTEIIPAFGLHPWHTAGFLPMDWFKRLTRLLERFPNALVGEIGLDQVHFPRVALDVQTDFYLKQCRLAAEMKRPVILHCVRSWGTLVQIMKEERLPAPGFLCHGFSAAVEHIDPLTRYGGYFSLGPKQLIPEPARSAQMIPKDRLLMESDGSTPETYHRACYEWALYFGQTPEEFRKLIIANTRRFLHLKDEDASE